MMPRLELDADQAVQEVLNAWGVIRIARKPHPMPADFSALFEKMLAYRTAKSIADNRRNFHLLTEKQAEEEQRTKKEFLAAYREFDEARGLMSPKARND